MSSFNKRVKQIARAEKDVDKVLRAARLSRNPIDHRFIETVLEHIVYMIVLVGMFGTFIVMMVFAR